MGWETFYEDTEKRIERDSETGEERLIYVNPDATDARVASLTAAVDQLILDTLGA